MQAERHDGELHTRNKFSVLNFLLLIRYHQHRRSIAIHQHLEFCLIIACDLGVSADRYPICSHIVHNRVSVLRGQIQTLAAQIDHPADLDSRALRRSGRIDQEHNAVAGHLLGHIILKDVKIVSLQSVLPVLYLRHFK